MKRRERYLKQAFDLWLEQTKGFTPKEMEDIVAHLMAWTVFSASRENLEDALTGLDAMSIEAKRLTHSMYTDYLKGKKETLQ